MSNYVMLGFNGRTRFQWFMFQMGFNGLCFKWVSVVYVSVDYFDAFQAKTLVDLRWCGHNDLCELNIVFF